MQAEPSPKPSKTKFEIVDKQAIILVGPGNNGGDGLVTARYLAQMGVSVAVYIWRRNVETDKNWALLEGTGVQRLFGAHDPDGKPPEPSTQPG